MSDALRMRFDVQAAEVSGRKLRAFSREAFGEVGYQWDEQFKMRHFEQGAENQYSYKPRSPKYLARKKGGFISGRGGSRYPIPGGGQLPIVYTGATRSAVRQRLFPRTYPTRVTISLPTPSYVRMRPYKRNAPSLGEELTAVTDTEYSDLEATYQRIVEGRINEAIN